METLLCKALQIVDCLLHVYIANPRRVVTAGTIKIPPFLKATDGKYRSRTIIAILWERIIIVVVIIIIIIVVINIVINWSSSRKILLHIMYIHACNSMYFILYFSETTKNNSHFSDCLVFSVFCSLSLFILIVKHSKE